MNFIWFVYTLLKKVYFFHLNTDENITLMLLSSLFSMIFLIFMCIPSVITYLYFLCLFPINLLSFCLLFCFLIPHFLALLLPSFSLHTRHPLHPSILDSIRGGEVLHIFAWLPREDICSFLSRGQDKDYFIHSNTFKKHLQSKALTCRRRGKKKRKKEETMWKQDAFCNFTWFLDYFSIFWKKDSTWNCRSDAGTKAVMTFLTALRLKPKGNFTVNCSQHRSLSM